MNLRDETYTDAEVEYKIMSRLENDEELDDILFTLCMDKQVKGLDIYERRRYLKGIIKKSSEIKDWLNS